MKDILSMDNWIYKTYPEMTIADGEDSDAMVKTPGTAWVRLYSSIAGCDYIMEYDTYAVARDRYCAYVSNVTEAEKKECNMHRHYANNHLRSDT